MLIDAYHNSGISDEFELVILGDGMERERLERLASGLGLSGRIDLAGAVENPFVYMRNAEFLVMSSRYEGFGNVLVESLACGTPVISFDCVSGPAEIIEHGSNGLLVPPGDVDAMAAAIRTVARDGELLGRLGENARESVGRFDISSIRTDWIEKVIEDEAGRAQS
jgi:N-acetylgalactosamine-N,N'-diacetylbacillosaminyl-diphospho-undecaprenol 4-alpha-N-acetylgalactosaminyltransferase